MADDKEKEVALEVNDIDNKKKKKSKVRLINNFNR